MLNKLHFASYYRWLIVSRHLQVQAAGTPILDVGCDDAFFLLQQMATVKVGVDLHPRISPGEGLFVVQADGCYLPFVSGTFEMVFAFDIIEHIADDWAFLAALLRMLAPGGRLWLSTPTENSFLFPTFLTRRAMHQWGHQRVGYTVEALLQHIPAGYQAQVRVWNATVFRHTYFLLRVLAMLSPTLARGGAALCFEIDRRLGQGKDHIFLEVVRECEAEVALG